VEPVGNQGDEPPACKVVIADGIDKKIIKGKDADNREQRKTRIVDDVKNLIPRGCSLLSQGIPLKDTFAP
jgi:hypothetical protein